MNEWQPIETAPKDGTQILGWAPSWLTSNQAEFIAAFLHGKWWHMADNERVIESQSDFGTSYKEAFITHWMLLPAPPDRVDE